MVIYRTPTSEKNTEIYEGTSNNDTYSGSGLSLRAHGFSGADKITGKDEDDFIFGDDGEDSLTGGKGRDLLDGGWGNDSLFGEADRDILEGWQGKDLLDGGEDNDYLYGGSGDDELLGGSGNDFLYGGDGADKLNGHDPKGGSEIDELFGGAGADIFILGEKGNVFYFDPPVPVPPPPPGQAVPQSYARIGGETGEDVFQPGIDKIQLAGAANKYTFVQVTAFGNAGISDTQIIENSRPGDSIAFVVDVPLADLNIANDVIFV